MTTDPNWLVEGGHVAVIGGPLASRRDRIAFRRIERLTARDVVLDNGDRFRRASLRRQQGGQWGSTYRLADPADELVRAGYIAQRKRDLRHSTAVTVQTLMAQWDRDDSDEPAREALSVLRDALQKLHPEDAS